mmetsp:Transcript_1708/g.3118  ORF Transcript_1708/g.3118 Transcript_1708/m.3118 type:complete len:123 (-) Transcript_1708:92-460(-)
MNGKVSMNDDSIRSRKMNSRRVDNLGNKLLLAETTIEPKCQTYVKSISRKNKSIDLEAIGTKHNNHLVDFLRCQAKTRKQCSHIEKAYLKCHGSVMGTGSFQGNKHCGEELENFLNCVLKQK